MQEITDRLFEIQDLKYRDFNSSLNPTLNKNCFIGVRTPLLRSFAKEIKGTELAEKFILELPHKYFEENQLHAILFDNEQNFDNIFKIADDALYHSKRNGRNRYTIKYQK